MYNLNVSLSAPPLLGVGPSTVSCTTPRTPEILNSVIAMTNPMDTYQHHQQQHQQHLHQHHQQLSLEPPIGTPQQQQQQHQQQFMSESQSLPPQILTNEPSTGSNSDSSSAVTPTENEGPPSVIKTRSLLIKYGLKLTIESKRKQSAGDSSGNETSKSNRKDTINSMDTSDDEDDDDDQKSPKNGLTPEDEERRRRRRERNKIAATKCRLKKREKTINLVSESEILEKQNTELKDQERKLEKEIRKLLEALQHHSTGCVVPGGYQAPTLPSRNGNGCCTSSLSLSSIKTEPVATSTSGRGRRANGTRGRAGGRGGGGGRGCRSKAVKQEPINSPVQPDKSILPNIMSSVQLPHFPTYNGSFYPKYDVMDESPSQDFNYDVTLTTSSVETGRDNNCANYLLKSPTTSVDSMTTAALNDLSNGSTFSYPLATPVNVTNGGNGGGATNGMLHIQPSPLIKNDLYIPNCENSNDLLQCSNPMNHNMMHPSELYHDMETEAKLHEMNLNGNGNNLSCYDDAPLFSVFC